MCQRLSRKCEREKVNIEGVINFKNISVNLISGFKETLITGRSWQVLVTTFAVLVETLSGRPRK